jgi:hypothetical protein
MNAAMGMAQNAALAQKMMAAMSGRGGPPMGGPVPPGVGPPPPMGGPPGRGGMGGGPMGGGGAMGVGGPMGGPGPGRGGMGGELSGDSMSCLTASSLLVPLAVCLVVAAKRGQGQERLI